MLDMLILKKIHWSSASLQEHAASLIAAPHYVLKRKRASKTRHLDFEEFYPKISCLLGSEVNTLPSTTVLQENG